MTSRLTGYSLMGSTESQATPCLEREYRLIRRFISPLYDNAEVTVIEHKQTKEQFILKESVQQLSPDRHTPDPQTHRSLSHRNLIQLRRSWIENDNSICSTLFKVYSVFEYHENTLEEWLQEATDRQMTDRQVADFVRQITSALAFLERNRVFSLLVGPKSIAVAENKQEEEQLRDNASGIHHRSASKLSVEPSFAGRRSFAVEGVHRKESELHGSKETKEGLESVPKQRKVYKIFEPLEGSSASKWSHGLDSFLQVPTHPSLATLN